MTTTERKVSGIILFITLLMVSGLSASADGAATFESFYRASVGVGWVFAGIAAILIGILVFVGVPVLAPWMISVIGAIGTNVGGLFGFAGVAATNFGLAILGGGAIASGGFGIIAGTALLATALTFGTEVVIDYGVGALISRYESTKFAKASLGMMTLPLPMNMKGPDSVKAAGRALESRLADDSWNCARRFPGSVNEFKECLAAIQKPQRQLIREALVAMDNSPRATSPSDMEREASMYALLHFLNNNYIAAKKASYQSYVRGIKSNNIPTLAAFIASASMLYDERPRLGESIEKFEYSITAEPKNPLTPVLFSAYLDRLSYRLNDGAAGGDQMDRLSEFAGGLAEDERKLAIQQTLLAHHLMQIKLAQQKIISLTGAENRAIRESPRALGVVKASLRDYGRLLKAANALIVRQDRLLSVLAKDISLWKRLTSGVNPFTDTEMGWPKAMLPFRTALAAYQADKRGLDGRVSAFEAEFSKATKAAEGSG